MSASERSCSARKSANVSGSKDSALPARGVHGLKIVNTRQRWCCPPARERELSINNLLVRIHFIMMMIRWTELAPWEAECPCTGRGLAGHASLQTSPGAKTAHCLQGGCRLLRVYDHAAYTLSASFARERSCSARKSANASGRRDSALPAHRV